MKQAVMLVFKLGKIFGFTPFHVRSSGEIFFEACSFQTFYFLFILTLQLAWTGTYLVVFINSIVTFTTDVALAFIAWVCGSWSLSSIYLIYWFAKDDITRHICKTMTWWNINDDTKMKRTSDRRSAFVFTMWIFSGLLSLIITTYLQMANPGGLGFMSSYFLEPEMLLNADNSTNIVPMAVPTFAHVGSSIAHIWMVIYYVFGTFVGDLIPIVIALNYTTAYERITEELIDTCSASYKGKYKSDIGSQELQDDKQSRMSDSSSTKKLAVVWTSQEPYELDDNTARAIMPCSSCQKKASRQTQMADKIRLAIRRHMGVTSCLQSFNNGFASLLLLFTFQMFVMCAFIVYSSFVSNISVVEKVLYGINSIGFLIKATIGFYYFGSVADAASNIKSAILMHEEIHNSKVITDDDDLARELMLFFDFLSEACVNPGGYMAFSRSYLATFYGILVTYVALLVQSV